MSRLALYVQLACIWEATARKPGNVHRYADFEEVSYLDFVASAAAIGPVLANADRQPLGDTILQSVQATQQVCRSNSNLGIILLIAPLAAVPREQSLFPHVNNILDKATLDDSVQVFEAIRLAKPGGLGHSGEQDVHSAPTYSLRQVMSIAAKRDMIAKQYHNGFQQIANDGLPALLDGIDLFGCLEGAIIHCHLTLLAEYPDSLIARKCGIGQASKVSAQARTLLDSSWKSPGERWNAIEQFDTYLRSDGNRLNPGTTADLVTASLFAALRDDKIHIPLELPWTSG